jgi:hypothetical protein
MNVFFDDVQHSSGVQLPMSITVPEFEPAAFFVAILILTILSLRVPQEVIRGKKAGPS